MYLIVGLGNPGDKFVNTRHNLGFEAVDEFRRKTGLSEWSLNKDLKSEIIKSEDLLLARPITFMNLSGMAVSKIKEYYKIPASNIIVVYDELDMPLGHMKVRMGGSAAGHHGLESIIESLGTDQFIRVRLGIEGNWKLISGEHKHSSFNAEKYVVDKFLPGEKSKVKAMIKRSVKAIETILKDGVEKAQNQFNDKGA